MRPRAATTTVRGRAIAGAALIATASSVGAWSLAYPQGSLSGTAVRALTDCAAVVTLGLAVVPLLDTERYRAELIRRTSAPLAVAAAAWLVAELTRLVVVAARTAGVGVTDVGMGTTADVAVQTTVGRSVLFSSAAAALICVAALAPLHTPAVPMATVGLATAGLAGRTLAGHLSESALGGVAVAAHTLAAALWCGALAALALTIHHRGQWARVLPRFSQLALLCVAVLLVAGTAGAVVQLDSPTQLYASGYGRVLSAKIAVLAALVLLAWRNRTGWLPAARAHRASAERSRSRSYAELAIMVAALTLAAGLAVTG